VGSEYAAPFPSQSKKQFVKSTTGSLYHPTNLEQTQIRAEGSFAFTQDLAPI
jgi:hypothetical protein